MSFGAILPALTSVTGGGGLAASDAGPTSSGVTGAPIDVGGIDFGGNANEGMKYLALAIGFVGVLWVFKGRR